MSKLQMPLIIAVLFLVIPRAPKTGGLATVPRTHSPSVGSQPVGDLSKAERAVLAALYWVRDETITPSKVAFYAGYSVTSSSFGNALSGLRTRGLLAGWKITDAGESLVADMAGEKPSGADLRQPRSSAACSAPE
jgi:hypothetical protein